MAVTLICPNLKCRSILQVPDRTRGRKVRCGKCNRSFVVPQAAKPSVPLTPAEAPPAKGS